MSLTQILTIRSLKARPTRMLLSIFGIILGVAAILGIGITNQTALDSVKLLFEDTSGKADLMIISSQSEATGISENIIPKIERIDEIKLVAPSVHIVTTTGDLASEENIGMSFFGTEAGGLLLYGIDPEIDTQVRNYEITQGRFLSAMQDAREIVIVDTYADESEIKVLDNDDQEQLEVHNIEAASDSNFINGRSFIKELKNGSSGNNRISKEYVEKIEVWLAHEISDVTGFPIDMITNDTYFEKDLGLESITMKVRVGESNLDLSDDSGYQPVFLIRVEACIGQPKMIVQLFLHKHVSIFGRKKWILEN